MIINRAQGALDADLCFGSSRTLIIIGSYFVQITCEKKLFK